MFSYNMPVYRKYVHSSKCYSSLMLRMSYVNASEKNPLCLKMRDLVLLMYVSEIVNEACGRSIS